MADEEKKGAGGERGPSWDERLARAIGLKPNQGPLVKAMVSLAAIAALFMLWEWPGSGGNADAPPPPQSTAVNHGVTDQSAEELRRLTKQMEADLARQLSMISGAGEVEVHITLSEGIVRNFGTDTRVDHTKQSEEAADGSTRTTNTSTSQTTHVFYKNGGSDSAVIRSMQNATVSGVLIVADGAKSARVRESLHEAAVKALGAPAHRITVKPREGR